VLPYLRRLAQEPTRHGANGHRLFLTFAASSVCASANVRTIADANAANALGVGAVNDGFTGQTMRTAAGMESGWISSTVSLSPERVRAPLASTTGDDGDTVPPGASRPRGAVASQTGADLCGFHEESARLGSCAYVARGFCAEAKSASD
jgi:hypothetical protein